MLGLSRQSFYKQRGTQFRQLLKDDAIIKMVEKHREKMPKTGTVKLLNHYRQTWSSQGIFVGRDRLYTLLRKHQLLIRKRRRSVPKTTNSFHSFRRYPDLINTNKNQFSKPNQVWVSDITYIPIEGHNKWCYLFLITDMISKKIVGYHLSANMSTMSAVKALTNAINNQTNSIKGLIHHSDRGVQYCSESYVKTLVNNEIKISMTQSGSPYDNAVAERINGILKHELIYPFGKIHSLEKAHVRIKQAIDTYNCERSHMSINFQTPELAHFNI